MEPSLPWRRTMLTTLRRMAGGVLSLTGVCQVFGFPGDIPTWLRFASARVSAGIALTNRDVIGLVMVALGLVLLFAPRIVLSFGRYLRRRAIGDSRDGMDKGERPGLV